MPSLGPFLGGVRSSAAEVREHLVASAAKALQGAVEGLGTAALAGMEGDSKPLVLKSPDLNMTVEARPAAALSEQPISCDTAGEEVRVELPASVLAGAGGAVGPGPAGERR